MSHLNAKDQQFAVKKMDKNGAIHVQSMVILFGKNGDFLRPQTATTSGFLASEVDVFSVCATTSGFVASEVDFFSVLANFP